MEIKGIRDSSREQLENCEDRELLLDVLVKINVLARAEIEIDGSASFYDSRKIGLGSDFLMEVERTFSLIAKNPQRVSQKY